MEELGEVGDHHLEEVLKRLVVCELVSFLS